MSRALAPLRHGGTEGATTGGHGPLPRSPSILGRREKTIGCYAARVSALPADPPGVSPPERPFDGDPMWRASRILVDGTRVTIRPVVPEDREELRRGFLALSEESKYSRFLEPRRLPTDDLFAYLTEVDQIDHVALGATVESPDLKTERGIGIARFVRLERSSIAEAAITVVDDMHRRGVATVLLHELLRAARHRKIRTLRAEVLADNETMRLILERAGATKAVADSGEGTIAYDLAIGKARERSLLDVLRGSAQTMALRFQR